ncbi:radial spoke head protein 9 homolog [Dysidea avara]|uniref:radial spoke head protein 9 homolog n=1 Tax=Dysidea avara TaxID=196820 RepID=UPI003316932C
MDAEGLHVTVEYLSNSGVILSPEQKAALQISLPILRSDHKLKRVKLWGKVQGIKADYFIAHGVGEDELKDRKAVYSQDCLLWVLLPFATDEMISNAAKLMGRFTGDPSFINEYKYIRKTGDGETMQEESVTIEMKEEDRLAAVVASIDQEVSVVPRGAYIKNPLGGVRMNRSFEGLSIAECKDLSNFLHFREPQLENNKNALLSIDQSLNFLDSIEYDLPKGCWSLQFERGSGMVVLRSLIWFGLVSYHIPNTTKYGYFYCGTGERNNDLPFML